MLGEAGAVGVFTADHRHRPAVERRHYVDPGAGCLFTIIRHHIRRLRGALQRQQDQHASGLFHPRVVGHLCAGIEGKPRGQFDRDALARTHGRDRAVVARMPRAGFARFRIDIVGAARFSAVAAILARVLGFAPAGPNCQRGGSESGEAGGGRAACHALSMLEPRNGSVSDPRASCRVHPVC